MRIQLTEARVQVCQCLNRCNNQITGYDGQCMIHLQAGFIDTIR